MTDSPNGIVPPPAETYHAAHSHLQAVLQRGRFAITAEIGPPRGANVAPIRRKARLLRDWVDAANVTDSQSAVVRLPSWAGCLVAMQEGVEPVMQILVTRTASPCKATCWAQRHWAFPTCCC